MALTPEEVEEGGASDDDEEYASWIKTIRKDYDDKDEILELILLRFHKDCDLTIKLNSKNTQIILK